MHTRYQRNLASDGAETPSPCRANQSRALWTNTARRRLSASGLVTPNSSSNSTSGSTAVIAARATAPLLKPLTGAYLAQSRYAYLAIYLSRTSPTTRFSHRTLVKTIRKISAINIAYLYAIIIALQSKADVTNSNMMNAICSAVIRDARKRDQSVVVPTVLIDAQVRSRKTSQSNQSRASSSARPQETINLRRLDYEFRYFVDRQGRQHFNFRQRVWLDVSVQMAYTRVYSVALKTLAVNLLMLVTPKRNYQAAARLTSRQAMLLAPSFIRDCLSGAPDEAWALPRTTIEAWLESRLRTRVGADDIALRRAPLSEILRLNGLR